MQIGVIQSIRYPILILIFSIFINYYNQGTFGHDKRKRETIRVHETHKKCKNLTYNQMLNVASNI